MWRMFVIMLGGLLYPLSPVALACGEPSQTVVSQPRPKSESVKQTIAVELRGKVVLVRCLMFGRTSVGVTVGNETYWLDARDTKDLQSLIQHGPTVLVTGEIDKLHGSEGDQNHLVNVTGIRADDAGKIEYVAKAVKVEIRGKLQQEFREFITPYDACWYVAVDGKDYYLHLNGNKTLFGQGKELVGQAVILNGTLEVKGRWNVVHVTSIKAAPVSPFKITFGRTSGIPDFHPTADVTFDSTKLSAKTAGELRKLIGEAKFFDLRSSMDQPLNIPDPPAGYNLTLEMDGKKHTIWVTDTDMTPALKTLVDRMKDGSTEVFCQKLIGMELDEAKRQLTEAGYTFRLTSMDGVFFPRTDDYRPNRINLAVEKGKVVEARVG